MINIVSVNLLVCRFFEPDAVHKDEKVEKNRIAADYTRVRASQERRTETGILC